MTTFEHLLAFALLVVAPAISAWEVPRLARRLASDPDARAHLYVSNMAILWGVTTVLVVAWWWAGRAFRDLGLQLPQSAAGWWWTLLLCCAAVGFIVQQAYSFATSPDADAQLRESLESQPGVAAVLPSTPHEARVFAGAAITAGICEEVLYRGYLLWYFQSLVPGAVAIAVAIVVFGLAHVYQGIRGVLSTGAAGALAMGVYLLTGSLLAPILLHAVLDLVNGLTVYRVSQRTAAGAAS